MWDGPETHPDVFKIGVCVIKLPNLNNYQDMAVLKDIRDNPIPEQKSEAEIRTFRLRILKRHGTRLLIRVAQQLWRGYADALECEGNCKETMRFIKFIFEVLKVRVQINRNKNAFIEAEFNPNRMNKFLYGK